MHIAASANCKLIGLFGPGVRNVFYPMDDNAIVLHHFKKRRHSHQTEGNSTILQISTEEVRAAIQQLMTNNED
jgi:ADP-heptose:LPS heptosyltransferase